MRGAALAVLSWLVIGFVALSAQPSHAGEYHGYGYGYGGGYGYGYRYGGGYGYRPYYHNSHVWYSSSCCYRRVVRHSAYYAPVGHYGYGHHGYYDRPYRYGYYDRPYRYGYYDRPYRYYDRPYRYGYYDRPYRYSGYLD